MAHGISTLLKYDGHGVRLKYANENTLDGSNKKALVLLIALNDASSIYLFDNILS